MAEQKQITEIPPELEARFPEFVDKWLKIGLNTDRIKQKESVEAINKSYQCANLNIPHYIVFVSSPYEGCIISYLAGNNRFDEVLKYLKKIKMNISTDQEVYTIKSIDKIIKDLIKNINPNEILRDQMQHCIYGSLEASWLSFYDVFGELIQEIADKISGLCDLATSSGFTWVYDELAIITDKPEVIKIENDRLHCKDGPAIRYSDGFSIYAWKGIRIPERLIEDKKSITVDEIHRETNAEMRRIKLEIFGEERFVIESGAKPIHTDDFGTLYRIDLEDDEPLCMVKVINSTPEPDGSFKDYFLRVPPTCVTAKEAVAWTFDVSAEEYTPATET